jgi:uncharacterized cupredoxin-like copper-binding protein
LTGEIHERSSFSKTRHGQFRESDAFRMVFESVLQTCLREGLVGGETFATDASVIEADARVMRRTDDKEPPDDWNDPGKITRPVREYLDQLDKAAGLSLLSGESPQPPKSLSLTDPQAALTSKGRSKIAFAYGDNYLISNHVEVQKGEQIKFILYNSGELDHEFVLATALENRKHAEAMKMNPEMEHHDPNATRVSPKKTDEIAWRFTKPGEFEFACLIPGHRDVGMFGTVDVR